MNDPLWVKENQLAELILIYIILNGASRILVLVRGQEARYAVVCNLYFVKIRVLVQDFEVHHAPAHSMEKHEGGSQVDLAS
ncbi:predicted protein [Lichtheimia corymbifera JMRC:FSU:9682]|uniref:Uncharacterized protein n=1 Tax=Lichtheimia corymbifera JMRC:FSU:9682 TaxID=1263082 RepID=A0A068RF79_9FUNG|nr:predicted protein [Lichtheimia corymbifera JMRC:FSU:9682]